MTTSPSTLARPIADLLPDQAKWTALTVAIAVIVIGTYIVWIAARTKDRRHAPKGLWVEDPETGEPFYSSDGGKGR